MRKEAVAVADVDASIHTLRLNAVQSQQADSLTRLLRRKEYLTLGTKGKQKKTRHIDEPGRAS
jgi:hypothetical protein